MAPYLLSSPGGAALTGPTMCQPARGPSRPDKAQPPPGKITAQQGCLEGNQCCACRACEVYACERTLQAG
ncbi:hypothetical protein DKC09_08830 [Klebsiella quasipneumoniae]|uniref:Uncharacterized protein n=1 Tax=Klebsiella quasipneumoniae TaxID=1463165 RepID=A0AAI8J0A6_9ENTR|nr:hypothetical protein DKC11_05155 [Klebsiella quasipneumoniae]AWL65320.1 hypothetical protein DKC00_28035 [Klebsiella quasipneumoniae]AWL73228.1 hypothetical protein DKC09_08830 [Klebsiella quasipneumoniae]